MEYNILLFIAGILGGAINSIAGGGGILMYPALLLFGIPPIVANATTSFVVFPGITAAAFGYRKELKSIPKSYLWLALPSLLGASIGASLLVKTSPESFENIAPTLVMSAVVLLAIQSHLHKWLSNQSVKRKINWQVQPLIFLGVFAVSVYGGFFSVGAGLMLLALFGFTKLKNQHQMNAVKNFCGTAMTFVATLYFINAGLIDYESGFIMALGTITGGYLGAKIAHRVSSHTVHNITLFIGIIVATILIINS